MSTKRCTKCGQSKLLDAFSKDARRGDGLRSHCRQCVREAGARWYAENADRRREYNAKWRAGNADRAREAGAKWRAQNADRHRENSARWTAANPDRVAQKHGKRRAAKRQAPHVPYSRAEIFARWNSTCAYCDAPAEHLDHVVALSRGGADAEPNLLPACAPCNLAKGAKTLAEWATTF